MTFTPDLTQDCLLVDGTETVTLQGSANVSVAGAKRGLLTNAELQMPGLGLTADDMGWNLPQLNLAGVEPRIGDVVVDASSTKWTVVSVARAPLAGVWRLLGRRHR